MADGEGKMKFQSERLNGAGAIAAAASDCQAAAARGVPGYPVTELAGALFKAVGGGWADNEKAAMALAVGASAVGRRNVVVTKQVGGNVLLDTLVAAAYQGINAGIVVILGDDPHPVMSIHPQDSRWFGAAAGVAVLDPQNPASAYVAVREAFTLSEETGTPVIVRVTPRMLESSGLVKRSPGPAAPETTTTVDREGWRFTWHGRARRLYHEVWPALEKKANSWVLNRAAPGGNVGLMTTGSTGELVRSFEGEYSHLSLAHVYPPPLRLIEKFLAEHEPVIMFEEPGCFLESLLGGRVFGKLTGHVPFCELKEDDVRRAVSLVQSGGRLPAPPDDLLGDRQPGERICDDCPFAMVYQRLSELKTPVAGDQGCTTYAAFPPLEAVDLLYDLGSGPSVAAGCGQGALAVTGDYALLHSGLAGLLDAVHHRRDLKLLVLANGCSALTGGQPTPDLYPLVTAVVGDVEIVQAWQFDIEKVKKKLKEPGVWVQFILGECPKEHG